ncbi:class A beta-lactamase-related serine hydrolase [Mucilaginibacter daejeonensis]|uniref:serine hydrolase n=1 Tax=Mucilaginibacter daejeonensis TaxID=398049 RepID=UPI001D1741A3|nr:serine hydrolase [Mucilaginibacter daejeonensis]UEG51634.1 class A beta-lactamase-related serine hydrolase [Mucilaginibacter daejeonensis]
MSWSKPAYLILLIAACITKAQAQPHTDAWLQQLLYAKASPAFRHILDHPEVYHVQIIYNRIDRDRKGKPAFTRYEYNVDPGRYFYPASTVKLPTAALALEKLDRLHSKGVDKETPMLTDSAHKGQSATRVDTSATNKLPSIGQYIKKVFLVSDNDAYSRLFEFVGQQTINERLQQMGYTDTHIPRRFFVMPDEDHRYTNPISFVKGNDTLYKQPMLYSTFKFDFTKDHRIPRKLVEANGAVKADTLNLATHNTFPLRDQQQVLQAILFPASVKKAQRFKLTDDDRAFLYRYMSMLPSQSVSPAYDARAYFDSYGKFFSYRAGKGSIPSYIHYYNKAGWAYNFLTDNAYIVDVKNNVDLMLAAVIDLNLDATAGDRYEKIGYPFFKELGDIIYQYELQRTRPYRPALTERRP